MRNDTIANRSLEQLKRLPDTRSREDWAVRALTFRSLTPTPEDREKYQKAASVLVDKGIWAYLNAGELLSLDEALGGTLIRELTDRRLLNETDANTRA